MGFRELSEPGVRVGLVPGNFPYPVVWDQMAREQRFGSGGWVPEKNAYSDGNNVFFYDDASPFTSTAQYRMSHDFSTSKAS